MEKFIIKLNTYDYKNFFRYEPGTLLAIIINGREIWMFEPLEISLEYKNKSEDKLNLQKDFLSLVVIMEHVSNTNQFIKFDSFNEYEFISELNRIYYSIVYDTTLDIPYKYDFTIKYLPLYHKYSPDNDDGTTTFLRFCDITEVEVDYSVLIPTIILKTEDEREFWFIEFDHTNNQEYKLTILELTQDMFDDVVEGTLLSELCSYYNTLVPNIEL